MVARYKHAAVVVRPDGNSLKTTLSTVETRGAAGCHVAPCTQKAIPVCHDFILQLLPSCRDSWFYWHHLFDATRRVPHGKQG